MLQGVELGEGLGDACFWEDGRSGRKMGPGESTPGGRTSNQTRMQLLGNEESLEREAEGKEEGPVLGGSSSVPG